MKDIFFIDCTESKDRYGFGILHKDKKKEMRFVAKDTLQKETWKNNIERQIEKHCPTHAIIGDDSTLACGSPNSWSNMDIIGQSLSPASQSDLDEDRSSSDSPSVFAHIQLREDWSSTASGDESCDDDDAKDSEDDTEKDPREPKEPKALTTEDGTLTAADLNTILWWLIYYGDFNDPILIRTFLYSCSSWAPPLDLFNNLLKIYDLAVPVPKVLSLSYALFDTRKRVTCFLQIWLEHFFERDFFKKDKVLYENLLTFIEKLKANDQEMEKNVLLLTIIRVNKKFYEKKGIRFNHVTCTRQGTTPPSTPKPRTNDSSSSSNNLQQVQDVKQLVDWNIADVAEQFALLEFSLFKKVDLKELSKLAWKSAAPKKNALNVINLFTRFEMVSQWAAMEIVMAKSIKLRITIIEKLIQLAQKCVDLRNFNSLMEILAGLNRGSVQRMKKTWEGVSQASRENFRALNQLMDPLHNFKNYRDQLRKNIMPCLPYFGIFLRDLTFTEEGNPEKIGELINFEKIRITSRILKDIQNFQQTEYSFTEDEALQSSLKRLLGMPEEMLYKHSQTVEPTASSLTMST